MVVSERFSQSLELVLDLRLGRGGRVCFSVQGPWAEDFDINQFAYAIKKVLDIVGAVKLEDIKGMPVRAIFANEGGLGDLCIGIGNFLSDDTFIPREERLWKFAHSKKLDLTSNRDVYL